MKDVKALIQLGNSRKARWFSGKLVKRDDNNSVVEIYGTQHTIENRLVKEWKRIEPSSMDDFANKNWAELKQVVRNAVEKFLPNCDEMVINDDEKTITYSDVVIGPTIVERESIASFIEVPAWTVSYYKHIPATFHEPEDVDEVSCGNSENNVYAARLFIDTILRLEADCYWENVSYSFLPEYD